MRKTDNFLVGALSGSAFAVFFLLPDHAPGAFFRWAAGLAVFGLAFLAVRVCAERGAPAAFLFLGLAAGLTARFFMMPTEPVPGPAGGARYQWRVESLIESGRKPRAVLALRGTGVFREDRFVAELSALPEGTEEGDVQEGTLVLRPFKTAGLPGEWDEGRMMRAKGYSGACAAKDVLVLEKAEGSPRTGILDFLKRGLGGLRDGARDFTERVLFGSSGVRTPTEEGLRSIGAAHVLAVSGLHVRFLFMGGLRILAALGSGRRAADLLLFGVLGSYAWLLGFPASVVRALLFLVFRELSVFLRLGLDRKRRMLFALTLLVLLRPFSWEDPGLLLSFSCAFALDRADRTRPAGMEGDISSSFRVSLSIFLWTWPVQILLFGSLSPFVFLANLLLLPVFELYFGAAVFSLLLHATPAGALSDIACSGLFEALDSIVGVVSGWAGGTELSPELTPLAVGAYYAFLALFLYRSDARAFLRRCGRRYREEVLLPACRLFLTLFAAGLFALGLLRPAVYFEMIDIGQGDCLLFRSGKTAMLFDVGGRFDPTGEHVQGERLARKLRRDGIGELSAVFLSHRDMDHIGNLASLARSIPIRAIYRAPARRDRHDELLPDFLKPRVREVGEREVWTGPGFRLEVISEGAWDHEDSNDNSMVLLLDMGPTVLLTGDLEAGDALLAGDPRVRDVDVLKVAHHGSSGGSGEAFLDWTRPRAALISCGRENRYGHPNREVLRRLSARGIPWRRTDTDGAVLVLPRGEGFVLRNEKEPDPAAYAVVSGIILLFFLGLRTLSEAERLKARS